MLEQWAQRVSSNVTSSDYIAEVLSMVRCTLSKAARRVNSSNKVTTLPPAVLLCIFDHLRSEDPDFLCTSVSLSRICSALGQSMFKTPELWTDYSYTSSLVRADPEGNLLHSLVARAGPTLPLDITMLLEDFMPSINYLPTIHMLSEVLGRTRRLDLTWDLFHTIMMHSELRTLRSLMGSDLVDELWKPVCRVLNQPAPQLRSFSIRFELYNILQANLGMPWDLFAGHAPLLNRVNIHGPVLNLTSPCSAFEHVEFLSYHGKSPGPANVSAETLRLFLNSLPRLVVADLSLSHLIPWPDDKPKIISSRSALKNLRISSGGNRCSPFITFFTQCFPSLRQLALLVADFPNRPQIWDDMPQLLLESPAAVTEAHFGNHLAGLILCRPDSEPFRLMGYAGARHSIPLQSEIYAELVTMTLHEFYWPSVDANTGAVLMLPPAPNLQNFRLILASCTDHASNETQMHASIFPALGVFHLPSVGATKWHVPALQTVRLSHRLAYEYAWDDSPYAPLLSVSLADVYTFVSTHVLGENASLRTLALEGCEPIDIDLSHQLDRLRTLASDVQILPPPPPSAILSDICLREENDLEFFDLPF